MRLFAAAIVLAIFSSIAIRAQPAQDHALDLVLPTDNDALFSGDGASFYQYVERDYKGVNSKPLEDGHYGFVRDAIDAVAVLVYDRLQDGIVRGRFHRDPNGEPLVKVRAIP